MDIKQLFVYIDKKRDVLIQDQQEREKRYRITGDIAELKGQPLGGQSQYIASIENPVMGDRKSVV